VLEDLAAAPGGAGEAEEDETSLHGTLRGDDLADSSWMVRMNAALRDVKLVGWPPPKH